MSRGYQNMQQEQQESARRFQLTPSAPPRTESRTAATVAPQTTSRPAFARPFPKSTSNSSGLSKYARDGSLQAATYSESPFADPQYTSTFHRDDTRDEPDSRSFSHTSGSSIPADDRYDGSGTSGGGGSAGVSGGASNLLSGSKVSAFKQKFKSKASEAAKVTAEWRAKAAEKGSEISAKAKVAVAEYKERSGKPGSGSASASQDGVASAPVFGVSLTDALAKSRVDAINGPLWYPEEAVRNVPAVFYRCIEYLDIHGLEEVGIYRVSGSTTEVANLRHRFNTESDIELIKEQIDPNAVASLFKAWLRELPESILTDSTVTPLSRMYQAFQDDAASLVSTFSAHQVKPGATGSSLGTSPLSSVASDIPPQLVAETKKQLASIPNHHRALLYILFSHLNRVTENEAKNKMGLANLQVIFCPTLSVGSALFKTLILERETLFGPASGSYAAAPGHGYHNDPTIGILKDINLSPATSSTNTPRMTPMDSAASSKSNSPNKDLPGLPPPAKPARARPQSVASSLGIGKGSRMSGDISSNGTVRTSPQRTSSSANDATSVPALQYLSMSNAGPRNPASHSAPRQAPARSSHHEQQQQWDDVSTHIPDAIQSSPSSSSRDSIDAGSQTTNTKATMRISWGSSSPIGTAAAASLQDLIHQSSQIQQVPNTYPHDQQQPHADSTSSALHSVAGARASTQLAAPPSASSTSTTSTDPAGVLLNLMDEVDPFADPTSPRGQQQQYGYHQHQAYSQPPVHGREPPQSYYDQQDQQQQQPTSPQHLHHPHNPFAQPQTFITTPARKGSLDYTLALRQQQQQQQQKHQVPYAQQPTRHHHSHSLPPHHTLVNHESLPSQPPSHNNNKNGNTAGQQRYSQPIAPSYVQQSYVHVPSAVVHTERVGGREEDLRPPVRLDSWAVGEEGGQGGQGKPVLPPRPGGYTSPSS
ncbi:uncharacterized protein EV422DRAFT_129192 [Fimicolochytrium jonesii]|uniref:uncharacterized protein n=1 Tax=Fimicolochytrium jonesii TaxID=1396493 RepID=UPI0022FDBD2C|nr:uncharacterized protein EV422DRAFT_129192 [Fimicolochytrium jonesii]KAI8818992.1 hypothetical protein EV422DRAFT_129192 [Fimicolochytrium jonesii]